MAPLLALALLACCPRPSAAQAVDPNQLADPSQPADQSTDLGAKAQTQLSALMAAAGQPVSPAPREPPSKDWTPMGIAVCAALFGLSLLLRKDRAPAPAAAPAPPPMPGGEALGQLAIVRVIGQGGMGVVYEAIDRALDRRVALKKMREELRDRPAECAQFLSEAKTVAALHHPSIVEIYSIVQQAGEIYLVFEFVDGRTADDVLREHGRLALAQIKGVLAPVCQALAFAHGRGVIHRDLKPSNIMVTTTGVVKVMDFGIARRAKDALEATAGPAAGPSHLTNTLRGTPLYMAPEAESGILSTATDIYALGAMAYEMATGRPPFPPPASAVQKSERSYAKPSQAAPGLSAAFDALVDAALDPDPSRRPASAAAFWQSLAAIS